jgi:hypothetical protein
VNNAVKDIKLDLKEETTDQPEVQESKSNDHSDVWLTLMFLVFFVALVIGTSRSAMNDRIEAINKGFAMRDEVLNLALANFCPNHAADISRALGVEPLPVRPGIVESAQ